MLAVASAGAIEQLVAIFDDDARIEAHPATGHSQALSAKHARAREEAAAALWSLAANHGANKAAIADAGGITRLVAALGVGSVREQEKAAGALTARGHRIKLGHFRRCANHDAL